MSLMIECVLCNSERRHCSLNLTETGEGIPSPFSKVARDAVSGICFFIRSDRRSRQADRRNERHSATAFLRPGLSPPQPSRVRGLLSAGSASHFPPRFQHPSTTEVPPPNPCPNALVVYRRCGAGLLERLAPGVAAVHNSR